MNMRNMIIKFLRRHGYAITRDPRKTFFEMHDFDVVLDVGANRGQYGIELRDWIGFRKRIFSFEPMSAAFAKLEHEANGDPLWTALHCGLGNSTGSQSINVAGNSASSSILEMLPAHSDSAPVSAYVGVESIQIKKLDDLFGQFCHSTDKVLLKIDTQGYEIEVLSGAANSLNHVSALQLELSLSPLYDGAPLLEDVVSMVRELGFVPYWFLHGFKNPVTLQLLQMDGLFIRPETLESK